MGDKDNYLLFWRFVAQCLFDTSDGIKAIVIKKQKLQIQIKTVCMYVCVRFKASWYRAV